jgi:hypothetical protein
MKEFALSTYYNYLDWFDLPTTPTFYFLWILWFVVCFSVYHSTIRFVDKRIVKTNTTSKNTALVLILGTSLYFFNLMMTAIFISIYDFDGFLANAFFRSLNFPLGIIFLVVAGFNYYDNLKHKKKGSISEVDFLFRSLCFGSLGFFYLWSGIRGIIN